ERTRVGRAASAALTALVLGFLLGNLGVLPAAAPVHNFVWEMLVPLAIPMLLFNADLGRIVRESGRTLAAFVIAAVGTLLGAIAAFYLVPLPERAADLAGVFAATYIGGGVNFVGVSEALQIPPGPLLLASAAADNILTILYLVFLTLAPALRFFRKRYPAGEAPDFDSHASSAKTEPLPLRAARIAAALALSGLIIFAGQKIETAAALPGLTILFATLAAVLLATAIPRLARWLDGSFAFGMFLMLIFFASLGATANVAALIAAAPLILLFAFVVVAVHALVLFGVGRFTRFTLPELVTASNACVLGAATAAALAASQGWKSLVTPGVLLGTLGYAIATFLGVALAHALG
ncbi:MAG TPA: DUF819 family protein, partial [Sphingomonadales bacterium]|nr:DUF819 family protein [Sphingomonadales bacterium]